ncbi:MAG TPA: UPF0182 family protein [Jatrophihabitans sp.]|nr:UPF0182 family protein [Jatrophihabitans sp.]
MRPEMPSIRVSRRGKILIGVLVVLIVLVSLLGSLTTVYTNWLWFGEVGFRQVYRTILLTRLVLFLVVGLVMAVLIGANVYLAYRLRPPFRPISQEQENLERYRVALEPRKRLAFGALLALIFIIAGATGQANWKVWQLWRNGTAFGIKDQQFHRDISFFAWDYPFYRMVLGLAFNAVIFSLLLALAVHYIFGAFRIATPGPKLTISARRHVTILVFFFILLKACAYWLDRYGLVFSGRGKVTGASYTDVHASLPAKTILFWIALLIALSVLASLWLKSAQVPVIGFVVLLVLSLAISGIYPFLMQQFSVKPNANDKEAAYILRNIDATRQAYGIVTDSAGGTVTYKTYDAVADPNTSALVSSDPTISNIRILDPNVVSPTFAKFQQLRNVYGFPTKLDIDRYTVSNQLQDYVVGVRELDRDNLQGNQTNWISLHTLYTHGDGFVAAAASSDVTNTRTFTEGDLPPDGPLGLNPNQPYSQVYYGEKLPDYSIVGAQGAAREYDGIDQRTTYAGSGGIKLSNIFTRLAFAIKYQESNFVLNDVASATGAKIIFNRDPRQRLQQVAPFLTVDGDPYPAVVNGHIVWMLDGYTTLANYPYSERESLSDLTSDSLTATNRTAAQANSDINYIRNSVKATVDAYTGKVTLYQWDQNDPVLKTWMKVFPGLVKPKSDLTSNPDLLAHVRYPQDLFEVQRTLLEQYHVDDPKQFYSSSDKWTVSNDPNLTSGTAPQPPYYVLASNPAVPAGQPQFQLTTPMKVNNSTYLAAYISVDSDPGPNYGKMTVLKIASKAVIQGPEQIANTFKSTPAISKDISLLDTGGSSVIHGNMLTLPIGDSFLYVEPLYVQASGDQAYPILRRVQVAYGDRVGYAADLAGALQNLSQPVVGQSLNDIGAATSPSPSSSPSTSPSPSATGSTAPAPAPSTATPAQNQLLSQLNAAFDDLSAAYKTGDPAKIGEAQARVAQLTKQYLGTLGSAAPKPSK